ncbi:polysaccharide deacetylase family protein [Bdellovibrionota bacterium FG-1]
MRKPKNQSQGSKIVTSLLLLGTVAGIGAQTGIAKNAVDQPQGITGYDTQIRSDVLQSIATNAKARHYKDWHLSGNTPEDVFTNVRDQNSPIAWQALCRALTSLGDSDVALFEDELSRPENAKLMPCARPLSAQIQAFWRVGKIQLSNHLALQEMTSLRPQLPDGTPDLALKPHPPTDEIHVDTSKGETLYGLRSEGYLKEGQVAITIDDGPHPTRTAKILQALKDHGVRVTFFSVGQMAKKFPQLSAQEVAEGHIVGSHSWDHPNLAQMVLPDAEANIQKGKKAVEDASGVSIPFFRFPFGGKSHALVDYLKTQNITNFLWNMDSSDWKLRNPVELYQNVLHELNREKGGIILFHDIQEQTTIVLPKFLDELDRRGYQTMVFVPH